MLVTTKEMFAKSREKGYAIVAPDYWDSNSCRTYVETAEELGVPVILSFAQAHDDMLSLEEAYELGKFYGSKASVPVALHLDHGLDVETVKKAVDLGFTSVMIDASAQPYEVNVARTKEVCDYAHAKGVVVEAELGHVGSGDVITSENREELAENDHSIYTEVDMAKSFVAETGVDSLAVSIGTSHGLYKGTPVIDFDRLHQLRAELSVPLVLHGGSGSGDDNLERCATEGISKINVFTDFTVAAVNSTRKDYNNWYQLIKDSNEGIKEKLKFYFGLFHTGKADE